MNKELLLEVGTEEIPAKFMKFILTQLQTNTEHLLQEENLEFQRVKVQGTPRRLAVQVSGVADWQKRCAN